MTEHRFPYHGTICRQREAGGAPEIFSFQATAGQVSKWAFVDRLGPQNQAGVQRRLNPRKVGDIIRFFQSNDRNVIPTAVVVALRDNATVEVARDNGNGGQVHEGQRARIEIVCDIPEPDTRGVAEYPAIVIDGQHRLQGMKEFDENLLVNVVCLLGATADEIAFQFLVINNKTSKVDKKHLVNLALNYQEGDLNERLRKSANLGMTESAISILDVAATDDRSPFFEIIAIPAFQNQWVVPNAIELAYEIVAANSPSDFETEDKEWLFLYIWKEIKNTWSATHPAIWAKGSKLLSKVGLICFTQYMISTINAVATISETPPDLRDEQVVREQTRKVLEKFNPAFFLVNWTKTELDTKAGRELLTEAIQKSASNVRYKLPYYQEVKLIDSSSV